MRTLTVISPNFSSDESTIRLRDPDTREIEPFRLVITPSVDHYSSLQG